MIYYTGTPDKLNADRLRRIFKKACFGLQKGMKIDFYENMETKGLNLNCPVKHKIVKIDNHLVIITKEANKIIAKLSVHDIVIRIDSSNDIYYCTEGNKDNWLSIYKGLTSHARKLT
jgi:hypothetical protein